MELIHSEDKVEELLKKDPDNLDPELVAPEDDPVELAGRPLGTEQKSAKDPAEEEKPNPTGIKGGYLRQMLNDSDRF